MASFLSVFKNILHATEAAAQIAAPIVATFEPGIGALMMAAAGAAVSVEGSITAPNSGAQKQAAVAASTQQVVDVTNAILKEAGKAPLPANTTDVVVQQVSGVIVPQLNAVAKLVQTAPATPPTPPAA